MSDYLVKELYNRAVLKYKGKVSIFPGSFFLYRDISIDLLLMRNHINLFIPKNVLDIDANDVKNEAGRIDKYFKLCDNPKYKEILK